MQILEGLRYIHNTLQVGCTITSHEIMLSTKAEVKIANIGGAILHEQPISSSDVRSLGSLLTELTTNTSYQNELDHIQPPASRQCLSLQDFMRSTGSEDLTTLSQVCTPHLNREM
jgi:hypothetical protein